MRITCDPAKRQLTLAERGLDMRRAKEIFVGLHFTRVDEGDPVLVLVLGVLFRVPIEAGSHGISITVILLQRHTLIWASDRRLTLRMSATHAHA